MTTNILASIRSPLLALALVTVFAGTALATGATGFSATTLARGTVSTRVSAHADGIRLRTSGDVDFVTSAVNIAPLGSSGWHTHPGVVLVTVTSGSLTFYDHHCRATVHEAGSSFVESGTRAGLVLNLSATTAATVSATYIVPVGTTVLRIDKPNPGCPMS
jgi:quercetin dioxygenase-like cupin family protein